MTGNKMKTTSFRKEVSVPEAEKVKSKFVSEIRQEAL